MMSIKNKKVTHDNGDLSYYMKVRGDNGFVYNYAIHFSRFQLEQGRNYIASQLLRARADMRESVRKLVGQSSMRRNAWARGR